jgi:multiple antibiotic resistance protein
MDSFSSYIALSFGSLFSIVDPFTVVPIFLVLVGGQSHTKVARQASLTCFCVLSAFALAGSIIFRFFAITIPALKIAGGILLFAVALDMMRAKPSGTRSTAEERREAESKDDVGLIPLGLPLLSGPGAIATVMVLAGKAHGHQERIGLHVAITAVSVVCFLVLRSATLMARALGTTGMNVIGRIMGLVLSAVSTQFVIDGLKEAFPRLFA